MASRQCGIFSPCHPCADDDPVANFSAEDPDPIQFQALAFFAGDPPLNSPDSFWTIPASVAPCESVISQQDARDCATRTVRSKVWDAWVPDGTHGVPVRQFFNAAQTCQISCPDGEDPFIYTLPAGTVVALSQAEADDLAASICLFRAQQAKVCVPKPHVVTISLLGLDFVADMSDNAKVAVGGIGSFAAAYINGALVSASLPGSTDGFFFAVSPSGQWIAGYDDVAGIDHATAYLSSLHDLGTGPGGAGMIGNDITDDGITLCGGPAGERLMNSAGAQVADISTAFPNGFAFESNARVLNNTRRVVGHSGAVDGRKIYKWQANVATNISPAGLLFNDPNNKAISVAETGHACGTFTDGALNNRSWYYNGSATSILPNFGGFVTAMAMNESDMIVGQADNGFGFYTAFRWSVATGLNLLPSFPDITPGATAQANDVNDSGWIIGTMDNKGFVFHDNAIFKLVDLLPLGTGWTSIDDALFINNLKQVVGHGTYLGIAGTLYIMQLV